MKTKYDLEALKFMMSSVSTESRLQQAVSLQGVDPETCMIVFKNHWAQVKYDCSVAPLVSVVPGVSII